MEGKEKKYDKNELVIKFDCIKKVKDFLFILICKCGKIKLYIYIWSKEKKYDIYV